MKEKYIEERFPLWYVAPGSVRNSPDLSLVDDGTSMYAGVYTSDVGELVNRHNAAVGMIKELIKIAEASNPEAFKALWYGEQPNEQG